MQAMRILKYDLEPLTNGMITFPVGSKLLYAEEQLTRLVIYALVPSTETRLKNAPIYQFGTGWSVNDVNFEELASLGVVKLCAGHLMVHVFCDKQDRLGE